MVKFVWQVFFCICIAWEIFELLDDDWQNTTMTDIWTNKKYLRLLKNAILSHEECSQKCLKFNMTNDILMFEVEQQSQTCCCRCWIREIPWFLCNLTVSKLKFYEKKQMLLKQLIAIFYYSRISQFPFIQSETQIER